MSENSVVLDEFGQQALDRLNGIVATRNEKAGIIAAASGDSQQLLEALRDSSDNAQVVKISKEIEALDEKREALFAKRDEILKPVVAETQAKASEGAEGLTAEVDELDSQIRAAKNFLKSMYGDSVIEKVTALVGRKNRSSGGSNGTGRRIRGFDVYVDGTLATLKNAKGEDTSNLSAGAKAAGVDTATIQSAFFEAQGTKDVESFKPTVEFQVTDKEGNAHTVKCVQVTKNPGDAEPGA